MQQKFIGFIVLLLTIFSLNAFAADKQPVMIVTPFLTSVTVAPNSSANVEIVVQNNSTVNQTITDIAPLIPSGSIISADLLSDNCGFLSPGQTCAFVFRLNSIDQLGNQNLNVSVCSFNGTMCSRIKQPVTVANSGLSELFVLPVDPEIANGTQKQFEAIGLYEDNETQDLTDAVTWTSSDETKATISNGSGTEGLATSVATGTATITATLGQVSDSTTLTVTPATLASIGITPVSPSVVSGSAQQFTAVGIFTDNTSQDVTNEVVWTSSDTSKATISNASGSSGLATTLSPGATNITATSGAINSSTTLTVTPSALTSISVTPSNKKAPKGTTVQYKATGSYADGSTKDITTEATWSTASTLIALASNQPGSQGSVLAVEVGRTNVVASLSGITGQTRIRVRPAALASIDVTPINETLGVGEQVQYTATGIFTDNSTQDITDKSTWRSSNKKIIKVSNSKRLGTKGLAKGIAVGSATISARRSGITGTTTATVSTATLASIAVTPTTPTIANGTDQQFTATGTYSDTSTRDLTADATWTSSNTGVALISNASATKGLATSVGAGASTITASAEGVSGNTALTVAGVTLTSIAVTPANDTVPVDAAQQFTATGTYSDLSTQDITTEVTWTSSDTSKAEISNAAGSHGVLTGVSAGASTITAASGAVSGNTGVTIFDAQPGDNLQGGVIGCLEGGNNDLIAATADNSAGLVWGGSGTITNAQSDVDGAANTSTIVNVIGAGTGYAAGLCDAYEIDSAGNTPCVGGNTCYNDWFLPSTNQLACIKKNKDAIGGFTQVFYWSSTEYSVIPNFSAWLMSFASSGTTPSAGNKVDPHAVRCVRLINAAP